MAGDAPYLCDGCPVHKQRSVLTCVHYVSESPDVFQKQLNLQSMRDDDKSGDDDTGEVR